MKVLLVEDVVDIQLLIEATIGNNIELLKANNKVEAIEVLKKEHVDLILLDVSLPDADGFNLCTEIKAVDEWKDIPVFFLTGKGETINKVMAFNLGAEDYIVKPFDPLELKARVEAKLRNISKSGEGKIMTYGPIRIDLSRQHVEINDGNGAWNAVGLTFTEFKLLTYLTKNLDHVLSRNQIIDYVWGHGVHVIDRNVDSHVSALRKKLSPYSNFIKSVHGLGYKFTAQVIEGKKAA